MNPTTKDDEDLIADLEKRGLLSEGTASKFRVAAKLCNHAGLARSRIFIGTAYIILGALLAEGCKTISTQGLSGAALSMGMIASVAIVAGVIWAFAGMNKLFHW